MFDKAHTISDFLCEWLEHKTLAPVEQRTLWEYYAGYRRHFPARLQHYYSRQIQEVMDLLRARPESRVLEIGCGTGTESLWMAMQCASVTAVELSQDRFQAAVARKQVLEQQLGRSLDCRFLNESLLDLPEVEAYDILWMEQAFHHFEPRHHVVDKLVSLVKPGGHIVVSEANALNPLLQAQLFSQRGFKTIRHFDDHLGRRHPYGDERILTAGSLARLLAQRGVDRVSVEYFRVFPNSARFDSLLAWEQAVPRWMRPVFTHYNYVGVKRITAARKGIA